MRRLTTALVTILFGAGAIGVLLLGNAGARSRAWCTVSASYSHRYNDYDVYVHSNEPYQDAQVWQKGRDVYGYKTNGEGYADVYVFAEDVNAREGISVRVGKARCSGRL